MRSIVPIARLLFVALFLFSVPGHFKAQTIAYAAQQGVPFATILVPFSGLLLSSADSRSCSAGTRASAGGCSSRFSFP
jgi:hypothetical protein